MPSPPAGPLAPSSASPSAEAGVVGDIVGSGTKDGEGCADEAGVVIKANAKQSVSPSIDSITVLWLAVGGGLYDVRKFEQNASCKQPIQLKS